MSRQIQVRRDLYASWIAVNPILGQGEMSYAIDTKVIKMGDGINHWVDLPVFLSVMNAGVTKLYSSYTVIGSAKTNIPINIPTYEHATDVLDVYLQGKKLIPTTQYTIDNDYDSITTVTPVNISEVVSFEVIKNIALDTSGFRAISYYENNVTVAGSASTVGIGITQFNDNTDLLLVHANGSFLKKTVDYTISGSNIVKTSGQWTATNFHFLVLKSVDTPAGLADGNNIMDGSIDASKLSFVMEPHPATHPASIIVEDASRVFITPAQKTKLNGIADGATSYYHPITHPASMISIQDVGQKYASAYVEGALQEVAGSITTHQHAIATQTAAGFMSVADKIKVDNSTTGKQVFIASGSFTAPRAGTYKVTVTGGGGSGANNSNNIAGGGAGGTAIKWIVLTANQVVAVTVGAGATTATFGNIGLLGGTSSFGAYVSAPGGVGGDMATGSPAMGGQGGTPANGDINTKGGNADDANGYTTPGRGGVSFWGGEGAIGSGGRAMSNGNTAGSNGIVLVEW